jgi:hypothetical protein
MNSSVKTSGLDPGHFGTDLARGSVPLTYGYSFFCLFLFEGTFTSVLHFYIIYVYIFIAASYH